MLSDYKITEIFYTGLYLRNFFRGCKIVLGEKELQRRNHLHYGCFLSCEKKPLKVKVLQQPELRAYSFKDGATYNVSGTVEGCRLPKEIHCHFGKLVLITNCHSFITHLKLTLLSYETTFTIY